MLTEVQVKYFKKFHDETIVLDNPIVLAGPNNSGKTTLIQALSTWYFTLSRWIEKKSEAPIRTDKKKTGAPVTRRDFTPVPLREVSMLWENRQVLSSIPKQNTPLKIQIIVRGQEDNHKWECGMELQYTNPELFYCRPVGLTDIPKEVEKIRIVHIPPLAGLKTEEGRRDIGEQNLIIGEGRPGEILRNLLLEIYENKDKELWTCLETDIANIFQVKLLAPRYSQAQPYITTEYIAGMPTKEGRKNGLPTLDIASGGSGFHQVLLLLGFFYARPGSILLLDEPDAHLHVILQSEVYDHLIKIAHIRNSQLIIATHSEVILEKTEPTNIVAFTGKPHRLFNTTQKSQLKKALSEVRGIDFLLAAEKGSILYAEGTTDLSILREWATVLGHKSIKYLTSVFFKTIDGNDLNKARSHFYALKEAYPNLRGVCLLDKTDFTLQSTGLIEIAWKRREIENYLIIPSAINRFFKGKESDLFSESLIKLATDWMINELGMEAFKNSFSDRAILTDIKASDDFFEKLFGYLKENAGININYSKSKLYLIAANMTKEEIHPEIINKLDTIYHTFSSDNSK